MDELLLAVAFLALAVAVVVAVTFWGVLHATTNRTTLYSQILLVYQKPGGGWYVGPLQSLTAVKEVK